jgi:hypothetical protein
MDNPNATKSSIKKIFPSRVRDCNCWDISISSKPDRFEHIIAKKVHGKPGFIKPDLSCELMNYRNYRSLFAQIVGSKGHCVYFIYDYVELGEMQSGISPSLNIYAVLSSVSQYSHAGPMNFRLGPFERRSKNCHIVTATDQSLAYFLGESLGASCEGIR